jgi:hypothetical protein
VLDYCAAVAAAPDPNDPEAVKREAYNLAGRERVEHKNERLDPYSGRFFERESRAKELAEVVSRERRVEGIVRGRTWDVVGRRCGGNLAIGERWEEGMETWRRESEERKKEKR